MVKGGGGGAGGTAGGPRADEARPETAVSRSLRSARVADDSRPISGFLDSAAARCRKETSDAFFRV